MRYIWVTTIILIVVSFSPNDVHAGTWSKEKVETYRDKLVYVYVTKDTQGPYLGYVYSTADESFVLRSRTGGYTGIAYSRVYRIEVAGSRYGKTLSTESADQFVWSTIILVGLIAIVLYFAGWL